MAMEQVNPPDFSVDKVKELILEYYGLEASISQLVSYIDQNFYVKDISGGEYIFKIGHPYDDISILEEQNQLINHLGKEEETFEYPRVITSKSGEEIIRISNDDSRTFNARLLTFITGTFLSKLKVHSKPLLYSLGEMMGKVDRLLEGLYIPTLDRYMEWDLKNTFDLHQYTRFVEDHRKRSLAEYWIMQFETHVLPCLPKLRKSIIHNDANDQNILVHTNNEDLIKGLIDFGDLNYTHTIIELAVAMAYGMLDKKDPLEDVLPLLEGYHSVYPVQEQELDVLFYLICSRLAMSVVMSAYQHSFRPDEPYLTITARPAWAALHKLVAINPVKARNEFYKTCKLKVPAPQGENKKQLVKLRERYLSRSLTLSYKEPLKITGGVMQYLFDDVGKTYLDCVNNVCHVGHCHPEVVKAGQRQMAQLNTNTRYLHDYIVDYARQLSDTMPEPLEVCFIVNSGSEANELAIRLARAHTGQKNCIVLDQAYHGNTASVVELSSYKFNGPGGKGPLPYIYTVPLPDVYRGPLKKTDPDAGKKYAKAVKSAIKEINKKNEGLAAFFFESLPGLAGQIILIDGYLKEAFKYVREAGGVCVADEVQVGFGRVGSHFWGFETQDVIPDIVTLGKPIGNGHPIGAVVTTKEIARSFENDMEFFNTFGGNPVSCAIGIAVLDVIKNEKLQDNASRVGEYLIEKLKELQKEFCIIGDVRGKGFFIGIELVLDHGTLEPAGKLAYLIVEQMKERGILLSVDGSLHNVIKIKPPMVFSMENADLLFNILQQVLFGLK